jgi:methyl-accepting chemotaxis protein
MDPLFWLATSLLLVAMSLTAVMVIALPAIQELSRAARSSEKLFDLLARELPPTLDALREATREVKILSEHLDQGAESVVQVARQVDENLETVRQQAVNAKIASRSFWVGLRAALQTLTEGNTAASASEDSSATDQDGP